jgi:F0F1-type ATP synthase epsilon subunit
MDLIINSPRQKKEHKITWIEIDSPEGNQVIQSQHAPMIIQLKENSEVLYNLETGKKESVKVASGIVHIEHGKVVILASALL